MKRQLQDSNNSGDRHRRGATENKHAAIEIAVVQLKTSAITIIEVSKHSCGLTNTTAIIIMSVAFWPIH